MAKKKSNKKIEAILAEFVEEMKPLEEMGQLVSLEDKRTNAHFCECHLLGSKIVELGTINVPLDPDEQGDYRANRNLVLNNPAFLMMKDDAKKGRTFSNIVAEYNKAFDPGHPLKIIGGQHRFKAIEEALTEKGVDEYHGVKVYMLLNNDQRLDVQHISNTNIAVSADLIDRMHETVRGPELRDWCQETGLLDEGIDFADKKGRRKPITVQMARTFITNYYLGKSIDANKFHTTKTSPIICVSGKQSDPAWEKVVTENDVGFATKWTSDTQFP